MNRKQIELRKALPYNDVQQMLVDERGDWKQSNRFSESELLDFIQSIASNWNAERFAFCVHVPRAGICYITAHKNDTDGFNMMRLWMRQAVNH